MMTGWEILVWTLLRYGVPLAAVALALLFAGWWLNWTKF